MTSTELARALLTSTDFKGRLTKEKAARLFPQHPDLHQTWSVGDICKKVVELGLTTKEEVDGVATEMGWAMSPMMGENDYW